MTEWEIELYLQNIVRSLEFLMKHQSFWYNQKYKPSYIYNKYKDQVYNKMHTNK